MKKILVTTMGLLFVASTALALKVPMWRKIHEQGGDEHFLDVGSFSFDKKNKEWSFGYKVETPEKNIVFTSLRSCKRSENGFWSRVYRITYCDEKVGCIKQKDTDWIEYTPKQVGHFICEEVLPSCNMNKKHLDCK